MKKVSRVIIIIFSAFLIATFTKTISLRVPKDFTKDNPHTLPVNNLYFNTLSDPYSEVWYKISPVQSGSYEIVSAGIPNLSGTLYDSSKTKIIEENNHTLVSSSFRIASTLIENETYYLKLGLNCNKQVSTSYSIVIKLIEEPHDKYFYQQWGLLNLQNASDINILPVWKYTLGKNIKIAIADTGTDYTHEDLKNSVNLLFSYNFVHHINNIFPVKEKYTFISSKAGHGTQVAGIINSQLNNIGIVGIAPDSKIISFKTLGSQLDNHTTQTDPINSFIEAIKYARSKGIKIINCSFQGYVPNQEEMKAMQDADDVLFVIAAGNDSLDLSKKPCYPACYNIDNSIVVAALNKNGELSSLSNYGGPTAIAAPGEGILSTFPNNKYSYANGTSAAAPFVSAVCSLIWSLNESLTPLEVKEIITSRQNVTLIDSLKGKVSSGGMLNAYKAVVAPNKLR